MFRWAPLAHTYISLVTNPRKHFLVTFSAVDSTGKSLILPKPTITFVEADNEITGEYTLIVDLNRPKLN